MFCSEHCHGTIWHLVYGDAQGAAPRAVLVFDSGIRRGCTCRCHIGTIGENVDDIVLRLFMAGRRFASVRSATGGIARFEHI